MQEEEQEQEEGEESYKLWPAYKMDHNGVL